MKTNQILKNENAIRCLLTLTAVLLSVQINFANDSTTSAERGIFDLWNYREIIDVKLTFDLQSVFQDRQGQNSHSAKITFADETGAEQNWQIKISTRGRYRRLKCSEVPPLKINFKKGDLREAGLADYDDFKLVTHCLEDQELAKELLLKEYLTYRLFNQLTDISYRVQLVNITYEDARTGEQKEQLGFLIEDTAQLRARIGAKKMEALRVIDQDQYQTEYRQLVSMFQYLIGNADWGLTLSKNIQYVQKNDKVLPVPYDFDFAALVDAPYMRQPSKYELETRYARVYLGFERSREELEPTIRLLESHKEALYQTVEDMEILQRSSRQRMIRYLNTFFRNTKHIRFTENWY